jgi:hypothetical protein
LFNVELTKKNSPLRIKLLALAAMFDRGHRHYSTPFTRPIKDLLIDQRKGRFLTPYEKKEIQKYAEVQRKKKQN